MKKKILWIVGMLVVSLVLIVGIMRYIEVQKRENDSNWKIAKEIYRVENALKEVDADYECQSVSKVTPFTYTDSEGIPSSIIAARLLTYQMSLGNMQDLIWMQSVW